MTVPDAAGSFEAVYRRYQGPVSRFVRVRLGNTDDAQDLVAVIFATAWRHIDQMPAEPTTRGWLFDIARRSISNYWRSNKRRRMLLSSVIAAKEASSRGTMTAMAPGQGDLRQDDSSVGEALRHLRLEDQELLRMVYWQERSYDEVAAMLGCTLNALNLRLSRARLSLRSHICIPEREQRPRSQTRPPLESYSTTSTRYWRSR
jgi:RNA polymerase sigma-70 factor (ECF subfamily)